jgi:hypothetical protein
MMINSKYYLLRYLIIRTPTMLEGRHKPWREGRRQQRVLSDQVVELIRNYCNHMKNSNYITGISIVRGVVTVVVRSFSMEEVKLMEGHWKWSHINSRGIEMKVKTGRGEDSPIIIRGQ